MKNISTRAVFVSTMVGLCLILSVAPIIRAQGAKFEREKRGPRSGRAV